MTDEQKTPKWQEILAQAIDDPRERERIAQEAHVKPITLLRWMNNESRPRTENMRQLLRAMPLPIRPTFTRAVIDAFPQLLAGPESLPASETLAFPPSEFYARVLSAHAHTPPILYQQTMYDLLFQQMIEQIDPERQGMMVRLARCVPPLPGRPVRSLRLMGGRGTPPWEREFDSATMFVGAESLMGVSLLRSRIYVLQERKTSQRISIHWTGPAQSAAAYPLLRNGRVAGCLMVASACSHAFSPTRLKLIENYAHLMALAIDPDLFFDANRIELHIMPRYEVQLPYIHSFRQRVAAILKEAEMMHRKLSSQQAQEMAWQEIEQELIDTAPPPD